MTRLFLLVTIVLAFIYAIESAAVKGTSVSGKACPPVNCRGKTKTCPYGYQKKDGCDICKCSDPCNPIGTTRVCGVNQRCRVEKKADGTFGTHCGVAPPKKGGKGGKEGGKDGGKDTKGVCVLPKVIGACKATLPRFHYNSATKSCESFAYGGCGGNGNNFPTKDLCEKACKA